MVLAESGYIALALDISQIVWVALACEVVLVMLFFRNLTVPAPVRNSVCCVLS